MYATHIIGEPKYKYGQEEQVTVRFSFGLISVLRPFNTFYVIFGAVTTLFLGQSKEMNNYQELIQSYTTSS